MEEARPEDATVAGATLQPPPVQSISQPSWQLPKHYELRELLGSGSYGTVYEAADHLRDRIVAIKRLPCVFRNSTNAKRLLRELAILARLDHNHVVRLYDVIVPGGSCATFKDLYLVMEIGDTDLKVLMQRDITLEPVHVNTIFYNLLVALKYIHSAGIYHRDVKPANVLVNQDCSVKLCDFGLARAVGEEPALAPCVSPPAVIAAGHGHTAPRCIWRVMTKGVVSRFWRAPELILLLHRYDEAIDVWSSGCIYAEMTELLGLPPLERGPLFPGRTCFPLSPDTRHRHNAILHVADRRDMLNVIFDVIGTPSAAEVEQLEREDARQYMRCFQPRAGHGLRARLPFATPEMLDLVERMLRFGARERVPVVEALAHRAFADLRDPAKETTAPCTLTLDFERTPLLDEAQLRGAFAAEVSCFVRRQRERQPRR